MKKKYHLNVENTETESLTVIEPQRRWSRILIEKEIKAMKKTIDVYKRQEAD